MDNAPETVEPRPTLPVWIDGLIVQGLVPLCMWLSFTEWQASLLVFVWFFLRLGLGRSHERGRLLLAVFFGLLFEVALWRAGACFYQRPAIAYVPFWIFPLWGAGGLLICGIAAPIPWERPPKGRRGWVLLPFALNLLLPSSWPMSLGVVAVALLVAALAWGEPAPTGPSRGGRVLRVAAVGIGGTSASFSFGLAGICTFPQAWYGIPPWGLSLWMSLTVAILGLHWGTRRRTS